MLLADVAVATLNMVSSDAVVANEWKELSAAVKRTADSTSRVGGNWLNRLRIFSLVRSDGAGALALRCLPPPHRLEAKLKLLFAKEIKLSLRGAASGVCEKYTAQIIVDANSREILLLENKITCMLIFEMCCV